MAQRKRKPKPKETTTEQLTIRLTPTFVGSSRRASSGYRRGRGPLRSADQANRSTPDGSRAGAGSDPRGPQEGPVTANE